MNPLKLIRAAVLLSMALATVLPAHATSMFARQTGMPCATCHFQNFPTLNSFGRVFKAGGYNIVGGQARLEANGLSLPVVLNAGVVGKMRYQQSNGPKVPGTNTTNDGEFQFPDELLLMLGGRVNENIGVVVELDVHGNDPLVSGLKMPFMKDVGSIKAGGIPFSTSTQGVSYGFEMLNTGALRFARVAEDRTAVSAQQYIGTATRAQGFALVASNAQYFANFSKWSPRAVGDKTGSPTANYLRLAATPRVGIWDVGFGAQSWSGSATEPDLLTTVDTKAWAVDAQMQGAFGDKPLGIYLSYANATGSAAGANTHNLFNSNPNDRTAVALTGQLGVIPGKATVLLGYRRGDNGKAVASTDNALMVGGTYVIVQNVQLQLNHTTYSGNAYDGAPANGERMTTLMLYTSF